MIPSLQTVSTTNHTQGGRQAGFQPTRAGTTQNTLLAVNRLPSSACDLTFTPLYLLLITHFNACRIRDLLNNMPTPGPDELMRLAGQRQRKERGRHAGGLGVQRAIEVGRMHETVPSHRENEDLYRHGPVILAYNEGWGAFGRQYAQYGDI